LFTLRLRRLIGCTNDDWTAAQKAMKLWLLLGCLGLRANRAAGSVWPVDPWVPQNQTTLETELSSLGLNGWEVALIGQGLGKSPGLLRETASDTIRQPSPARLFGGINPREPSPVKFKVIRLGDAHCLLAAAPRQQITGIQGTPTTLLREAEYRLRNKPDRARWTALGAWHHLTIP